MGMFDDLIPAQAAPAAQRGGMFDDLIPTPAPAPVAKLGDTWTGMAADVGRSALSGLDKGVAGLAGAPADVAGLIATGGDWVNSKISGRPQEDLAAEANARAVLKPETLKAYGSQAAHAASPLAYEPQTQIGRYTQTAAEFVPAAALGPGNIAKNVAVYGLAPGLASEAAGQATAGTEAEPYARVGAGLLAGGVGAFATRPNVAEGIVAKAAQGLTPEQVAATEALMRDAQAAGVPLSRTEAAQQASNGATRLADLQRVVEGQGGLKEFYAGRPEQLAQAGPAAFDRIAPQSAQPSTIGPAVGRAAEEAVTDTQGAINQATRPLYQQADPVRVGVPVHQALTSDPLYAQTLQEIRNNPALNRMVENLPDDSVGVMHLVSRRMGEAAENARVPGQANSGNTIAANYVDAQQAPIAAATAATGGPTGTFAQAQAAQAHLRGEYLEPLMSGPIGKLAQRDIPTQRAVEALFPSNPVPGSAPEVLDAVTNLSARNPMAARQLVRAHLEGTFNEATQALQGGPNQFGGATFAAVVRGNRQQAENLSAAIAGLPGGDAILPGFDRFLDIMQATGQRQRVGSQTAFNTEALSELKRGGTTGTVAALAAGGGFQAPRRVLEAFETWNAGRNVDQIARILVDPDAATLFRHLATTPPTSSKAVALVSRLTAIGARGSQEPAQNR
jgi:hypothetical protein